VLPLTEHISLYFIPLHLVKNISTYLFATVVALASLSSCKKDDATTPAPAPSKTDLLTAKSWKVTDFKVSGQSIYNSILFENCAKDDLTKFSATKAVTFDEGAIKCDPSSPQSRTGSWELNADQTKLKLTDPTGDQSLEGTINTLTSTTLIVTDPNGFGNGNPAEVTYTAQ
jgi:hypothetical protein